MLIDIENKSDVKTGDILYMKESPDTNDLWHGAAVKVRHYSGRGDVELLVPNGDTLRKIGVDRWNAHPDWNKAHGECCAMYRLAMMRKDFAHSCELDDIFNAL